MTPEAEAALRNEVLDLRFDLRVAQEEIARLRTALDAVEAPTWSQGPEGPRLRRRSRAQELIGEVWYSAEVRAWAWDAGPCRDLNSRAGYAPTEQEARDALLAALRREGQIP